jgi:hypothetical protein
MPELSKPLGAKKVLDLLWAWLIYLINSMVCNGGEYQ